MSTLTSIRRTVGCLDKLLACKLISLLLVLVGERNVGPPDDDHADFPPMKLADFGLAKAIGSKEETEL